MMRIDSSWSGLPQAPNIIAPRHSWLTETPVRPRLRCSIVISDRSVSETVDMRIVVIGGTGHVGSSSSRDWFGPATRWSA